MAASVAGGSSSGMLGRLTKKCHKKKEDLSLPFNQSNKLTNQTLFAST